MTDEIGFVLVAAFAYLIWRKNKSGDADKQSVTAS
jgi:hypothetical protein